MGSFEPLIAPLAGDRLRSKRSRSSRAPCTACCEDLHVLGQKHRTMYRLKPHLSARGRALMKEILTLVQLQQEGEVHIATVGGFDLVYDGEKFGRGDNYHYQTLLQRGADVRSSCRRPSRRSVSSRAASTHSTVSAKSRNVIARGWRKYQRRLSSYQSRQSLRFCRRPGREASEIARDRRGTRGIGTGGR